MMSATRLARELAFKLKYIEGLELKPNMIFPESIGVNVWRFKVYHNGADAVISLRANSYDEDIEDAAKIVFNQLTRGVING